MNSLLFPTTTSNHDQTRRKMKRSQSHGIHAKRRDQRSDQNQRKNLSCEDWCGFQTHSAMRIPQKETIYLCPLKNEKMIHVRLKIVGDCKHNQGR